ncbi:MFS transporter [Clostridiaceae bacterium HSG29]|nr:MFS transporter [Clostridiaceae bacterium HSG29]
MINQNLEKNNNEISNKKMSENIKNNYAYTFFNSMNLTQGLWMIYLVSKGQSLFAVGLLESIFHITSFLMEVPTGAISDIYGRKISRLLGRIIFIFSIVLLVFANHFIFFAISFVFSALSYNLESGSGEALIYDSLKILKKEDTYMKIFGKVEISYQLGSTIALILGGYLAKFNYNYAFIGTIIIAAISLFYGFFNFTEAIIIKEENIKEKKKLNFLTSIQDQIENSLSTFRNQRKVGYLIIISMLMSSVATSFFFYLQNYFKFNGYSELKIGFILSIASLIAAFGASKTHIIEKYIKERGILMYIPIFMTLSLLGISYTNYEMFFYIFLTLGESILYIAVNDYINKLIESEYRATILSFMSMAFSLCMIIFFPIIGLIGDHYSLKTSFIIISWSFVIISLFNYYNLAKIKKH